MSAAAERVTYATLAAGQTEEFKRKYDAAVARVRGEFGARHPHLIDGQEAWSPQELEDRSPADTRVVLGRVPVGTAEDVDRALEPEPRLQVTVDHLERDPHRPGG